MITLLLMACAPEPGSSNALSIDCTAMVPMGPGLWKTPAYAWDEDAGALVQRCVVWPAGALTGADATIIGGASVIDLAGAVDQMHLQVVANGTKYLAVGGTATFDQVETGKASGSYTFQATAQDGGGTVDVSGAFDWCELGRREDCPARFEDTLLDGFVMTTPGLGTVEGKTSACRMLVDPTTGALQVDLQVAIWDGFNVGQRFVGECTDGLGPVMDNRLVFQAGGVDGPGSYGPATSLAFPGARLPGLTFDHPVTFLPDLNYTQACNLYYLPAQVSIDDTSTCSWTVDADAGRFTLDCTNARHWSPPSILTIDAVGDFHLEADCLYLEQPT